jgi:hypothetical protein
MNSTPDGDATMVINLDIESESEVVGIVISRGHRAPVEPKLSQYVWGSFPEAEPDETTKAA